MRALQLMRPFSVITTFAVLAACGGGGSAGTDSNLAAGPMTTVGAITGFGSVHVNGVHFRTGNSTQIMIDGAAADENSLKVGQIVVVHGSVDSDRLHGSADWISMQEAVRGVITATDTAQFTVLGQTVLVTADTLFGQDITPTDITSLHMDDFVEVSGFRDAGGAIVASFIEQADSRKNLEVVGTVSGLDEALSTFMIGDLIVDYSGAQQIVGFAAGLPADGDVVEVEGATLGAEQQLLATKIELQSFEDDEHGGHHGWHHDGTNLEGVVTRFVSSTDFDVAGQPVTTTDSTRYERGSVETLALNVMVEVEGQVDTSGVLVASEIGFRGTASVQIAGNVDSITDSTLSILGVAVQVNPLTKLRDDSSARLRMFALSDITVGDYIEVTGALTDPMSSQVLASKLRRENPSDLAELRAPVDSVDATSLVALGITIDTDASTVYQGRDGLPTDAAGFFADVLVGDTVRALGLATSGTTVLATMLQVGVDHRREH
jgi:Domain of unknown function (DUF5666)